MLLESETESNESDPVLMYKDMEVGAVVLEVVGETPIGAEDPLKET